MEIGKREERGTGEEELIGEGKQRGKTEVQTGNEEQRGVEKGPLEVTPTENSPIIPQRLSAVPPGALTGYTVCLDDKQASH